MLPKRMLEQMKERLEKGEHPKTIATEYNISPQRLYYYRKRWNLVKKPRY